MNEMLTHHPRDFMYTTNAECGITGAVIATADCATTEIFSLDPLIDWLPYHNKKYLPTWHLVKSYG